MSKEIEVEEKREDRVDKKRNRLDEKRKRIFRDERRVFLFIDSWNSMNEYR